jgi:enoyl-CoA hydratase/carnithine racemase
MTTPFLRIERDGPHVVTLTLNRPDKRNAISTREECEELVEACRRIQYDDTVRAVVVTGAGSAFCAGGDLKGMKAKTGITGGSGAELRESYRRGIQRIPLALYELDVPTIAAVNGPAIGAGLDLACMCDIRIASERASFAESFVKVGIVPGDGGAYLLQRVVGLSRAMEMSFTGDTIDAQAAAACGLVSRVVPEAELLPAAQALAAKIAGNPPQAVRMTKRLLREAQHARLSTLLELSAAYQALAHGTRDHVEAVDSILEKRRPNFEGR